MRRYPDATIGLYGVREEGGPLTVYGVQFVHLYLLGILTAFGGWVLENLFRLAAGGILDCRFHILPFLSPYALIPFAFHILFGEPGELAPFGRKLFRREGTGTRVLSDLIVFCVMCLAIFAGEIAVGSAWEYFFHVRLWDYTDQLLHVTPYASALSVLGGGGICFVLFRFLHPALLRVVRRVPHRAAFGVCITLGVLIVLDTVCMGIQIAVTGAPPMYWSVKLF